MSDGNGRDDGNDLRILNAIGELHDLFASAATKLDALHKMVVSSTNDQATLHQQGVDHERRIAVLEAEFALRRVG